MQNQLREKYETMFANYPDILEFKDILEMLGGVSEQYVRPLLQNGTIKNFRVLRHKTFKIPKTYFIDFVISDSYQKNKYKLKAQI